MNDYYNKESHGGNVSPKGHFKHDHIDFFTSDFKPSEHRYLRRHYPEVSPSIENVNQ